MIRYIVKRLLLGILVLFGVTVITFSITSGEKLGRCKSNGRAGGGGPDRAGT